MWSVQEAVTLDYGHRWKTFFSVSFHGGTRGGLENDVACLR